MNARTRSLHLYLVLGLVAVGTCRREVTSADIIWYPVDEEDGVFVSIYGEKYASKWEDDIKRSRLIAEDYQDGLYPSTPSSQRNSHSHRRRSKRQSIFGNFFPLAFSQPSNSFFDFQGTPIRPGQFGIGQFPGAFTGVNNHGGFPKEGTFPVSSPGNQWPNFQNQLFPRPSVQNRPDSSFWTNNYPNSNRPFRPNQPKPSQYPGTHFFDDNSLNPSSNSGGQFNSNPSQYPGTYPYNDNSLYPSNSGRPNRPNLPNPTGYPTTSFNYDYTTNSPPNSGRPDYFHDETPHQKPPNQPGNFESSGFDRPLINNEGTLVFPDEVVTTQKTPPPPTTTTAPTVTEPTTMSQCERNCPVTPEFNPVCGTDSVTYSNLGRLKCAQNCGKVVGLVHYGTCRSSRLAMPPRWNRPKATNRFFHF